MQARDFMTNGNGGAWQVPRDLPSWQVTQIPRRPQFAGLRWLGDAQEPQWLAPCYQGAER